MLSLAVYVPFLGLLGVGWRSVQLITGERREGEFGVYMDFFGEKLPSIPGEVGPLMLMSSLGYVARQHPQNDDVIWLLRLCFSIVPAMTLALGIPVLLYVY